jgi:lantibiotic modifying enzyme
MPHPLPIWRPILDDEARAQAEARLQSIIEALPSAGAVSSPTLSSGQAGLGVFLAYAGRSRGDESLLATARAHLEAAAEALADETLLPALFGGFAGIAWGHVHTARILYAEDDADTAGEIDEVMLQFLGRTPWPLDYDLVRGLVGFGVYLLERLPRPAAVEALELLVARLQETAVAVPSGITWHTGPQFLPPFRRAEHPDGHFDLGVAHGVPGVIAILAGVMAHHIGGTTAPGLLEGAVDWLLAQRLPEGSVGQFPGFAGAPGRGEPARLAWCYGDAGIAAALLAAADILDHRRLRDTALDIGRTAAFREFGTSGVADAGLCHGAAGLAHLFNRLYQATGEQPFLEAARAWFSRTVDMGRDGCGIGGYQAWIMDAHRHSVWQDVAGFLEGSTGIAAALLAATTSVAPDWDRFLLVSLVPPSTSSRPGDNLAIERDPAD